MKLNFAKLSEAYSVVKEISEQKLPFRLSLLMSRNLAALQKEYDFYVEQERKFALEYLIINQETGELEQMKPGVFRVQEGKHEECLKARQALDSFEAEFDIRKIPMSMLENLEFTPAQLLAIEFMIEEDDISAYEEYRAINKGC